MAFDILPQGRVEGNSWAGSGYINSSNDYSAPVAYGHREVLAKGYGEKTRTLVELRTAVFSRYDPTNPHKSALAF